MPEFFNVVTPSQAWRTLDAHIQPLTGNEHIRVSAALERVISQPLHAPVDLPAFPRATMDGYAVRASDTYGASEGLPAYLEVTGEALMGQNAGIAVTPGKAVLIHTGGMLPEGADAVVMVENVQRVDNLTLEVLRPVAPGENMLRVGDDIKVNDLLFPAGHLLRPQDIGGLMALGITTVSVFLRPRVSIISTGDEIVPPERDPMPGQVRDVNTYTLAALTQRAGAIPLTQDIVPDDAEKLRQALVRNLARAEIVVISAGSSVSTRDMTTRVIDSLGKPGILFHGISLRPGKPTIGAIVNDRPVFGLPGNPVSAMVVFDLLVKPAIWRIGGRTSFPETPIIKARLTHNIASITGREDYIPVKILEQEGELRAEPIFGESNLITTMIRADGMAQVPLDKNGLLAGETANIRLLE